MIKELNAYEEEDYRFTLLLMGTYEELDQPATIIKGGPEFKLRLNRALTEHYDKQVSWFMEPSFHRIPDSYKVTVYLDGWDDEFALIRSWEY